MLVALGLCAGSVERGRGGVAEFRGKFWLAAFNIWEELHDPYHAAYDYLHDRVHVYNHHHHHVEEDEDEDQVEYEEEYGGYGGYMQLDPVGGR